MASPPVTVSLAEVAREGLAMNPPSLPPWLFYDRRGSELFDRICELDEYYLTRSEIEILRSHAAEISAAVGSPARIVELGSGSGLKTAILLVALREPREYVAVDISSSALAALESYLAARLPSLRVRVECRDYLESLDFDLGADGARVVAFFPGSTIGNLEPAAAARFLGRVAEMCGAGGGLLIGVDLRKDRSVIERAYNDASGVTAEFNRNMLSRLNREAGADFNAEAFAHRAVYEEEAGRIEMRLISEHSQTVTIPGGAGEEDRSFHFEPGKYIVTEHSYKYDPAAFIALATGAGWQYGRSWTDRKGYFGLFYMERR